MRTKTNLHEAEAAAPARLQKFTFRMDAATRARLEAEAAARGLTPGAFLRSLLCIRYWPRGDKA